MDLRHVGLSVTFSCIALLNLTSADRLQNQYIGCFYFDGFSLYNRPMGGGDILYGMTLGSCRSRCQRHTPSTFFAVKGGDTCHCGEQFDRLKQIPDRSCSVRCDDDRTQICGGLLALGIYWVCPIGFYGSECDRRCSLNCQNHTRLFMGCYLNGTCPAGCQDGWAGPKCDRNLGPMLVLKPPAERSHSPRDGSFAWTCNVINADADVRYEVGWYSPNGSEITNTAAGSSNMYVEEESRSSKKLRVLQVPDWVTDNYTCRENIAGQLQTKNISIFVRPFITKFTVTPSVTVGESTAFSCEAQGLPRPQYQFYKGIQTGTPLQPSSEVVVDGRTGRVTFRSVQMDDEWWYTCKAYSDIGYATADGKMLVFAKPKPSGCSKKNGGCSQSCSDVTSGSHKCSCWSGYQLNDDGKTCRAVTTGGGPIGTILSIVAVFVGLVIVVLVGRKCLHKIRQKSLQSTVSPPEAVVNMAPYPGAADEASPFTNQNDRPTSRDSEMRRADEAPATNPYFAEAERPTEVAGLIPSAPPDVEPPSYDELFGGTRNKVAVD